MPKPLPIVVTGVASGIGAATAALLAEAGHPVIGIDRAVPASFDGHFVQGDLSSAEGIDAIAAAVREAAPGGIAGLANVAGVPGTAPWQLVLGINVFGLRDLTRALEPALQPGSSVVNLASSVAFQWRSHAEQCAAFALAEDRAAALNAVAEPLREESYLFSKQCVNLLTEYLAGELLPKRIRVNSVSPGPVQTPILEDFKNDHGRDRVDSAAALLGRFGEPLDIARVIVFLLGQDSAWVNGADLRVDGGLTAYRATAAALGA
ncbi:SDR family oxidoreductase [Salinibacterium sp. dk2585]|uniref:SDR family oxidoreductase n=1 Tax=unclassified Salinibacterium TaxID=2632331 RepID=UPI0011C2457E|nr:MULTISPECIES: SDR family oxidoreductase [unclassified Salinibacterium]QEE61427.1 SDR family oxidoreductase [Salinibacterium sp. dk2585]TXK54104.1 SDR family oxidoreductase [Salinibacterium sp. dk5596]